MSLIINLTFLAVSIFLLLINPVVLVVVLAINFFSSTFILLVQLFSSILPHKYKERKRVNIKNGKFVSIHVPTYNEPPYIVKSTLSALSRLDYENFEVIVIDNNTPDEAVWLPVKEYCESLGDKFKFIHVDNLPGYKAGALNYIMDKVNPATEFVAVIDADYIVKPDFIKRALQHFVDDNIGFVQFPQAFYNVGKGNLGATLEYKHFFLTYMNMSNYMGSLLTTGTLTVFKYSAINSAGKFNPSSLTEDAEIGLKLNLAGYKGVYVNEVVGEGLMPYDLDSYEKQKRRWAMGNAQIIKDHLLKILLSNVFNWKEKIAIISQLTAWLNFCLLPVIAILAVAAVTLFEWTISPMSRAVLEISFLTIISYVIIKLISFTFVFMKSDFNLITTLRGLLVHIGMQEVYSYSFWVTLISPTTEFIRTNKFLNSGNTKIFNGVLNEVLIMACAFLAMIVFMAEHSILGVVSSITIFVLFGLIFYISLEFSFTKKYSEFAFQRLNIKSENL